MSIRWIAQNKVRPGIYINFKGVPAPTSLVGTRGVIALPLAMDWGDDYTELYSTDLYDGKSLAKVGCTALDASSLIYRLILQNAYKVILARTNGGADAQKSTISLGSTQITATARHAGVFGNSISVKIQQVGSSSKYDVITCVGLGIESIERDSQRIDAAANIKDNEWVTFTLGGSPTLTNVDTTYLAGGVNGTESNTTISSALALLGSKKWDTLAIMTAESAVIDAAIDIVKNLRDKQGRKCQVVVRGRGGVSGADYEGVVTTYLNAGFKTASETVSAESFVAYVAGLVGGASQLESRTNHVVAGAIEIIGEGVPQTNEEIIQALKDGYFILSRRSDGAIRVEQDINSHITFTANKGKIFSKNKPLRVLDGINNDITLLAEKSIIGKLPNDKTGRNVFKGLIDAHLKELLSMRAIQDYDAKNDLDLAQGMDIDSVIVNCNIKPVDAMEKIYMTVNVRTI